MFETDLLGFGGKPSALVVVEPGLFTKLFPEHSNLFLQVLDNVLLVTVDPTIRVNYGALNVEEFGSVYEGLLEYDPLITPNNHRFEFCFMKGEGRASSGSHYTPDELVQPLIQHSLDYLIDDKLKEMDKQQALLSLRVCDVACGSGHILLNAARRIATELAIVRTGEDQPSPLAFREAVRDVIRHCIYGVDLNPLAVELCKVALWLEAHVPGESLRQRSQVEAITRKRPFQAGLPSGLRGTGNPPAGNP